jgi:hypothetical protein
MANLVSKLEDVLYGHGVTMNVELHVDDMTNKGDGRHFRWDAKHKALQWYSNGTWANIKLSIEAPGDHVLSPTEAAYKLKELVTMAINMQTDYDLAAEQAAITLQDYMTNVEWFQPDLIDPVQPVLPVDPFTQPEE